MLQEMDTVFSTHDAAALLPSSVRGQQAPALSRPLTPPAAGRYGEARRINLPVLTGVILAHAALFIGFMTIRDHVVHQREAKLTVLNLTPPPAPPPAAVEESAQTPEIVESQVATPDPVVDLPPRPVLAVPTTAEPVPQPAVLPAAATPAPRAAPPVPPSIIQASDLSARMVSGKPPRYPIESRRKKEQGTVVLSLILGLDGQVSSISVSRSSGFARLDDAALDAVRKWRWEPMIRAGQAVMVKGIVEIPFVLQA